MMTLATTTTRQTQMLTEARETLSCDESFFRLSDCSAHDDADGETVAVTAMEKVEEADVLNHHFHRVLSPVPCLYPSSH
jgi:hypothetical protein